jgi:hypothetical protein
MRKGLEKPVRPPFAWQISQGVMPKHDWLPFLYGKSIQEIQGKSRELGGGSEDKDARSDSSQTDHSGNDIPF